MDKVVALTGASGGLGRAMADGLAQTGYAVVLIDRDQSSLDAMVHALRMQGRRAAGIAWDLSDTSATEQLARAMAAPFGPIDMLVNNAGLGLNYIRNDFVQRPIKFWEVDAETSRRFFAVNGATPYLLACELVPEMIARGFGRIVNVTTSLDSMIRPGFAPYGGTKASLEAHSAIMAADLDGTGVTVNVLVPGGPADTPMIPQETGYSRDKLIPTTVMVAPLLWLLSREAADVTGHRLLAVKWDASAGHANLAVASGPIAWPQLGAQTVWPAATTA